MTDSDSSLSSPPSTDDEMAEVVAPVKPTKATPQKKKKKNGTILSFFKSSPEPVRKKRPASPPHEMVPEDNPDIAFIIMFRSRFADAFPPKTPSFGPQDIERGVAEGLPSPQVETLLCSLLALLLNRKKPIEKGHYGRALEEAIQTHRSQWPRAWAGTNPLSGGRSFNTMSPIERLTLLKNLILWGLHDSEVINNTIKETYKSRTNKDKNDTNIPLSVQPWGRDGDNRRYWLIEGQDDTSFRVYRESNPKLKTITWWSVAGSIEEIRALAQKLEDEDGTREAKLLSEKMRNAIPRFEATEEKRKRREYRLNRQAAFARPEPGFSLYEGRTRGKRLKYTFSDEEEELSDALGIRRSARHSNRDTPAVPSGPTVTASGRQVRSRATGLYGESLLSGQTTDMASPATGDYVRSDASEEPQPVHNRATRANARGSNVNGWSKGRKHIETYNSVDEMDDEDDATSWDGGDEDEDEPEQMELDEDEDDFAEETSEDEEPKTLVVRLRYPKGAFKPSDNTPPAVPKQSTPASTFPTQSEQPGSLPIGPPPSAAPAAPVPLEPAVLPAPAPTQAAPAQTAGPPLPPYPHAPPQSLPVQQQRPSFVPAPQEPLPSIHTLPQPTVSAQSHFPAPTPPYATQESAPPRPQYSHPHANAAAENADPKSQYPATHPDSKPQYPATHPDPRTPFQATTLPQPMPQPTPASSWQ